MNNNIADWTKKDGFKALFFAFYNPLCNYAFSILKNESDAKDVVNDVFLKIWDDRNKLVIEGVKLKSYLFKSTKNRSLEWLRKKSTKQKYEEVFTRLKEQNLEDASLEEDKILLKEQISNSVRQLPDKCKQIYLLRTQNGLTFAEIGTHLNISKRTAENQMAIAIKKIREIIKKNSEYYK